MEIEAISLEELSKRQAEAWRSGRLAPKGRQVRLTINMERQERAQLMEESRAYGLAGGRFMVAVFRDWLVDRRPLRLVPPLPREPWEPKK